MNRPLTEKLIAALRSGEYKQIQGHLKDDNGFCALGVACDVYDPNLVLGCTSPLVVHQAYGWSGELRGTIVNLNDYHGKSFAEIADYLEGKLNAEQA